MSSISCTFILYASGSSGDLEGGYNIYFDIKYNEATNSIKAADDSENQIGGFGVRLSLAPLVSVPVGIYDQYMCKDEAGSLPAKDMYLAGVDDYASAAHGQPYKLYA